MSLSYSSLGGGTTGFAIDTGDGTKTDVTLGKEYPAGGYQISSANGNQGLFIFFGASDGTPAGGTSSKSIVATKAFNKLTIIGVTANDLITFTYKETATLNAVGTSSSYSGAVVTSFSPNQVSSVNDTLILNGAALGTNVTVKFTGANGTPLNAKSITRVSDTQLIVTRPDTMPGDQDPYKITVQNPGIEPAVSTNVLSQPLYAGSAPTWSTAATLPAFTKNVSYTQQLLASDPDGTSVTYSFVNGSLPAGLTYAANSSTISGTPTGSTSATFTIRATEASGRYSDRIFTLPDAYPVFTTSPTLTPYTKNTAYSSTIIATDDSGVAPSLSIVGTMPNGLSFNALTGGISGTPTTSTNQTFTVRATDANGSTTDQTFTIPNTGPTWVTAAGSLGTFSKNVAFSTTLSATDDGTITYSLISGSLPTGITLSSNGIISGTASTSSPVSFTIRVTDDAGNYVDRAFSLVDAGPVWTTFTPTALTIGSSYSYQFVATDDSGVTPTYSISSGSLPIGLSLNSSTGYITGTPSAFGAYSYVIRATDGNGLYAEKTITGTAGAGASVDYSTPGQYSFTVASSMTFDIETWGAQGGTGDGGPAGAYGGYVKGRATLSPGTYYATVGGQGGRNSGGYNGGGSGGIGSTGTYGGGGGGMSDIRSGNNSFSSVIIVAGGGGGTSGRTGNPYSAGGGGGGAACSGTGYSGYGGQGSAGCSTGTDGGCSGGTSGGYGSGGGGGGVQSGGAAGGDGGSAMGTSGSFGLGGNGGSGSAGQNGGGGGGAGYYGGGGGHSGSGGCTGSAGGGSSWINTNVFSSVVFTGTTRGGNGRVLITGI